MSESTTASEAIAAALRDYAPPLPGHEGHCAQVVVNAVRLMSPEQLAELIGGAVETAWIRTFTKDGSGGPIDAQDAEDAAEYAARASLWGAGPVTTHFAGRVVGPWLPVIPVTHQGEETT